MNQGMQQGEVTKHQFISSRIHVTQVFLRIADTTSNSSVRERCIGDALEAFGDAVDYFEADSVMTSAQRFDIEAQLDALHRELECLQATTRGAN